jgi:hypothetical protein
MARAFESVFRKAQNATQNRLHLLAAMNQLKGFVLAYLGQIDSRVPYAPHDLVKREEVFEYPTDFAAMRPEDIDRLAKRGEQLTQTLINYLLLHRALGSKHIGNRFLQESGEMLLESPEIHNKCVMSCHKLLKASLDDRSVYWSENC